MKEGKELDGLLVIYEIPTKREKTLFSVNRYFEGTQRPCFCPTEPVFTVNDQMLKNDWFDAQSILAPKNSWVVITNHVRCIIAQPNLSPDSSSLPFRLC